MFCYLCLWSHIPVTQTGSGETANNISCRLGHDLFSAVEEVDGFASHTLFQKHFKGVQRLTWTPDFRLESTEKIPVTPSQSPSVGATGRSGPDVRRRGDSALNADQVHLTCTPRKSCTWTSPTAAASCNAALPLLQNWCCWRATKKHRCSIFTPPRREASEEEAMATEWMETRTRPSKPPQPHPPHTGRGLKPTSQPNVTLSGLN